MVHHCEAGRTESFRPAWSENLPLKQNRTTQNKTKYPSTAAKLSQPDNSPVVYLILPSTSRGDFWKLRHGCSSSLGKGVCEACFCGEPQRVHPWKCCHLAGPSDLVSSPASPPPPKLGSKAVQSLASAGLFCPLLVARQEARQGWQSHVGLMREN